MTHVFQHLFHTRIISVITLDLILASERIESTNGTWLIQRFRRGESGNPFGFEANSQVTWRFWFLSSKIFRFQLV